MAITLESFALSKRAQKPPRIVIHGSEGVGKTTFGVESYKPVFICIEEGLEGFDDIPNIVIQDYLTLVNTLVFLRDQPHEFGTLNIDSLDWLEPLVWRETCARLHVNSIEDVAYGKGYLEALTVWREILALLDQIWKTRMMAIILISHSEIKQFNPPNSESYERYQIKLHKLASALVLEWSDIVGFAEKETIIIKGKDLKDKKRGEETGRHLLHVDNHPAYQAKNHYHIKDALPLSWNALMQAIQNGSRQKVA